MYFWSCDITKPGNYYMICLISAIFKDRDFCFGPKKFIELGAVYFTILGVINYISSHVTRHKLFFDRKVPICLKQLLLDI